MHTDKLLDSPAALLPFRRWKIRWGSIAFLGLIHAVALVGTPWYIATHAVSTAEWAIFGIYMLATGFSITVGYHRLFAHAAFRASAPVRFLVLFFGAAGFQQSALKWASLHRRHHQLVDTPADPYNIKQGFWYAHMGWILFWKHVIDYANVQDLMGDRLAVNQHRHYQSWAIGAGVILPLAAGLAIGHPMGTVILAIVLRMVLIFHVTFCINSFAHTFGSAHYDYHSSGRDHWLAALLTNGEGYHNYHHRFPSDYRKRHPMVSLGSEQMADLDARADRSGVAFEAHSRVSHPRRASGNGSGARWRGPICRKGPGRGGAHAIRARRTRSAGPGMGNASQDKTAYAFGREAF